MKKQILISILSSALGITYATICMNLKHKSDINAMAQSRGGFPIAG